MRIRIEDYIAPDRLGNSDPAVLTRRLQKLVSDIRENGIRMHRNRKVLTGYSYAEFYDWDLYFETLFLSYLGVSDFCRNGVEMFLDEQHESGFIPRTMGIVYPKPRHHFKPFLAQVALLGCRQSKDYRWLQGKYYQRLERYLEYWFWHCDADKNGLCFWDGSDHSGMDNQSPRLGYDGVMEYEGVDLNCYLVRELQAMAQLAAELGKEADRIKYEAHAERLKELINTTFWCEEDGFYYDRSEKTGELNRIKTVSGFLPLWVGAVPKERAHLLMTKHLMNPDEFWLPYPIATWAKDEPGYYQERKGDECTWMGSTWIPTNYMVFHGLMNYGYLEQARLLADKTFELVISESCTREYYNGETGSGQGLSPFWGWSSLGYVMPLEQRISYDPTDITRKDFVVLDGIEL